jgi:hypothetical protein
VQTRWFRDVHHNDHFFPVMRPEYEVSISNNV